jgi:hypothetical protein
MAKGLLTDEEELRRFNAIESQAQPWYARALPMEGRATFLPFRDTMPGSVFNKRELAVPGLIAEAANAITAPARSLLGTDPEFEAGKEGVNMAFNVMGGGLGSSRVMRNPTGQGGVDLALNAWHGTPHEIKGGFDISKVGTGEGAQSYGHGMYFGEARGTGEKYAFDLANRDATNQGRLNAHANAQRLANLAGDPKYAADDVRFVLESNPDHPQQKLLSETLRMLESGDYAKPIKNSGNLYKVDIPDEQIPKMLDWDKPFNQQPDVVKKAFEKLYTDKNVADQDLIKWFSEIDKEKGHMAAFYNNLATSDNLKGAKDVSRLLSESGVTGVRYLDEGSRATGKGTSNFVVFDPATVKILEKNDIPIEKLLEEGLLGN